MRVSAGILLYRWRDERLEVLIGHHGGPFHRGRDAGAWTIPKGEVDDPADELLEVARREFAEETGHVAPTGRPLQLGSTVQKGGKVVHAWALEGDLDPAQAESNTYLLEWPPGSGTLEPFPELDRVDWVTTDVAREKLKAAQTVFVDRLEGALGVADRAAGGATMRSQAGTAGG